jgi:hypothetical protein
MGICETNSKKTNDILSNIWEKKGDNSLICPLCNGSLTMVQVEPIEDAENAYTPYRTVIECTSCDFKLETESFTILGSIRQFTNEYVEIGSWAPSGSRVLSKYQHCLPEKMLTTLQKTGELVEFLVVNNQVVEVIG